MCSAVSVALCCGEVLRLAMSNGASLSATCLAWRCPSQVRGKSYLVPCMRSSLSPLPVYSVLPCSTSRSVGYSNCFLAISSLVLRSCNLRCVHAQLPPKRSRLCSEQQGSWPLLRLPARSRCLSRL